MEMDMKSVVRLNFQNYDLWKQRTKQILIREGLWRIIVNAVSKDKSEAWIEKDERAAATIGYLVESSQLQLIKNATTAQETWKILEDNHVNQSAAGRVGLIKQLCRLELEEDGNVEEHLIQMDVLFDKLTEVGCVMTEDLKGAFIMASLPESYDSFVTMMEGQENAFSMKSLKTKLLNEHVKRQHKLKVKEEKAMKAATVKERKPPASSNDRQDSRVCFECGKSGHIRNNCYRYLSRLAEEQNIDPREKKNGNTRANVVAEQESGRAVCFAATTRPLSACNKKWVFDSGASQHMTCDKSFFASFSAHKQTVQLADGRELISFGVGHGIVNGLGMDGQKTSVKMKNVLYVPDLQRNLISVGLIASSGYQLEFGEDQCRIRKDGEIMLAGYRKNGVYWMNE